MKTNNINTGENLCLINKFCIFKVYDKKNQSTTLMTTALSGYIVDDELAAIQLISFLLKKDERVEVIGSNTDPRKALVEMSKRKPDVIFLDIDMPHLSGLDIIKMREIILSDVDVIMVTAMKDLALETIKYSPFDLLLKPVDPEKLTDVIDRLIEKRNKQSEQEKTDLFKNKLIIHNKGEAFLIRHEDIIYLEAEGTYTHLVTRTHQTLIVSKHLGYLETKIANNRFYRINRSQIINIDFLWEVDFKKKLAKLSWDESTRELKISRMHVKKIKALLS